MSVPSGTEPTPDPSKQRPDARPAAPKWAWRVLSLGIFLLAVVLGLLYQQRVVDAFASMIPTSQPQGKALYWVSPHDPNVRSDQPGKDSMGMDLVPVYEEQEIGQRPVLIDPVLQEDQVTTAMVERGPLVRTIQSIGTVAYAEPRTGDVTLKVDAWIEKLYVDYLGQSVRKGDPLFEIYSPELVATQQELLISLEAPAGTGSRPDSEVRRSDERNIESVRQRLRNWDLTDQQIDALARAGRVQKTTTFYSPFDGIVTEKMAFDGAYMMAGSMLYRIADLSKVWVYLYVYQDQIHCVYEGQGATMTLANPPGHEFHGKVVYVDPYLQPKIRAVKVRVELDNPELVLKPGMFSQVVLEPHRMGDGLKIPDQAVLDTGTRQLVYVALPGNKFTAREVTTGMELDEDEIEILSGLTEGERVVTSGQFLLDSESRLRLINRKFEEPAAMAGDMERASHGEHGGAMPNGGMSPPPAGQEDHMGHVMPTNQMPDMEPPKAVKE